MSVPATAVAPRLLLDLRGERDVAAGTRTRIELEGNGASIGRGADCHWQLDAAGVSRLHASVRHLDGVYFLEDHSTNGLLHNGAPLRPGFPAALRDGDRVQIDLFEIAVTLLPAASGEAMGTGAAAPSAALALPPPVVTTDASDDAFAALTPAPVSATVVDPLALFATSYTMSGATPAHAAPDWNHSPALADGYRARANVPGPMPEALLPEHWDRTRSEFAAALPVAPSAVPAPATSAAGAAPPASTSTSTAVPTPTPTPTPGPTASLTAAPILPPAAPSAPADAHARTLLIALVAGLMDVLRARAEMKNSLRLPATLIRRSENNPLKFAATAEEAVARLLGPPDPAYLGGTTAIDDAMHDVGQHQLALMAGMRAAFEHAFAHFDPARFEAESGAQGALAGWTGRPWRRYVQEYRGLQADPDERFRRLFGDAFAHAYEDQLLRARDAASPPHRERT
ncbi:type VI secretion system-associated FHA domain protein TagH [Xanthomonas translucens]|uniref:type VI secretion system-associated FHA domain protein TagH n=1 Tax=Xanthomonas campestris pv. translucens TaxID=343 RepID=UPI001F60EEB9|nr:type VI secretion system-associated FHA domain protein TagH [Xanthomonas translucens]UNU00514.1 type VI secretion system-associated FHA domain protein TagH [Xanthomonas translucens pv. translucens]